MESGLPVSSNLAGSAAALALGVVDVSEDIRRVSQNVSTAVSPLLATLGAVGSIVKGVMPAGNSIVGLVRFVINLSQLIKATLLGLGQDVLHYSLELSRDLLSLANSVLSGVPVLLTTLKAATVAVTRMIGAVAAGIGAAVYAWNIVQTSISYYRSYKVAKAMDAILESKQSPEEKVQAILVVFSEIYKTREELHLEKIENAPLDEREKVQQFLEDQLKASVEKVLGVHAYEAIKTALSAFHADAEVGQGEVGKSTISKDELFINAVGAVREAREILRSKMKKEMYQTVCYSLGLLATLCGIIFPALGVGMIAGYALWGAFVVLMVKEKVNTFVENRYFNREATFFAKPPVSNEIVEKSLKTLRKKIHPQLDSFKDIKPAQEAEKIAKRLLYSGKMSIYAKEAKEEMLQNLKEKMAKRVVSVLGEQGVQIEEAILSRMEKAKSAKELHTVWKQFESKRTKREGMGPDTHVEAKWKNLQERIKLLANAPDAFFAEGLRGRWKELKSVHIS